LTTITSLADFSRVCRPGGGQLGKSPGPVG
jgi:hypothetical protein